MACLDGDSVTRHHLTLVECAPLDARLTEASCVERHRKARGGRPDLATCRQCETGAQRAGEPLRPLQRGLTGRTKRVGKAVKHEVHCQECGVTSWIAIGDYRKRDAGCKACFMRRNRYGSVYSGPTEPRAYAEAGE